MNTAMNTANDGNRKSRGTGHQQTEEGGLANQSVTRPAPIDQADQTNTHSQEPEQQGLEDLNVTRPSPPDTTRRPDRRQ